MLGALKVYARANQATIVTPVHPRRRDVAGDGRRNRGADAGRGACGHVVCAAGQSRRAGDLRQLRLVDLDAVGRADVRHARAGAGAVRDGGAGAPARRAVPLRRRTVRVEDPRRAGRVRVRQHAAADLSCGRQFRAARRGLARRRAGDGLREVRDGRGSGRHDADLPRRAWTCPRTARRWMRSARSAPASISSAAPIPRPISRLRSTARRWPTTTASSSGRPRARATWPSAPTCCGRSSWPSTQAPPLDPAIDEALLDYINRRKASFPDSNV